MTKLLLAVLLFACALPACATTYYLSPTGNDANSGTTAAAPWLSPYHAVNCGDVILAAASTSYSSTNFTLGRWGPVNCPAGNNVAWLKCETFDTCKITVPEGTHDFGIAVSSSYWGVQGWEVSNLESDVEGLSCFAAQPAGTGPNDTTIHHVIFANDIASTCALSGIGTGPSPGGAVSVDYVAIVGSIAYNTGTSNVGCGSGIGVFGPAVSDTVAGTHIFVAGNFSYGNVNPPNCWDANGISLDGFDGHGILPTSYSQQAVVENNISIGNQGVGVRVQYNNAGNGPLHAHIYVLQNTMWGNSNSWNQIGSPDCGEYQMYQTEHTYVMLNLAATVQQGCYNAFWNPNGAFVTKGSDASNFVMMNWGYSAWGYNTKTISSPTFVFGPKNVLGTDPQFASPQVPGAPNCGAYSSVPACMASVVANFAPKAAGASAYGYQVPVNTPVPDAYFPQWLCNVNLPTGLISTNCAQAASAQ